MLLSLFLLKSFVLPSFILFVISACDFSCNLDFGYKNSVDSVIWIRSFYFVDLSAHVRIQNVYCMSNVCCKIRWSKALQILRGNSEHIPIWGQAEPINIENPMYLLQSKYIYCKRCCTHVVDSINARVCLTLLLAIYNGWLKVDLMILTAKNGISSRHKSFEVNSKHATLKCRSLGCYQK